MRYSEIFEKQRREQTSGKTLYHGTLLKFVPEIMQIGLQPTLGEFTRNAYLEYEEAGMELPELVFAADKEGLGSCVSAILDAMEQAGIKRTTNNFFKYGAIVVIRSGEHKMSNREHDDEYFDRDSYPTVEPGDFFSENSVQPDYYITGEPMRRLLRRYGVNTHTMDADEKNFDADSKIKKELSDLRVEPTGGAPPLIPDKHVEINKKDIVSKHLPRKVTPT